MELKRNAEKNLWLILDSNYKKKSYSNDINDSMFLFAENIINKKKFKEEEFIKKIINIEPVEMKSYSKLLVKEIPGNQKESIAILILRKYLLYEGDAIIYFMNELFENLNECEVNRVFNIVRDMVEINTDRKDIRIIIKSIPVKYWNKLDEWKINSSR